MSTALRIAAVTQVLKDLLNDGLINNDVSGITQNNITVSSLPPDRIKTDGENEASQLNIFMYQATYNAGWQNVAYPSFNTAGDRTTNPPLALDLHYFLTAYGASELHTDILLGMGMQFFHETPVLARQQITQATGSVQVSKASNHLPDAMRFLSRAELAAQVEQIKLTPEGLSIEDISKLWAAFGAKYRPTAAYKVTVVLIESERSVKPGLPVRERRIYAEPFKIPVIEKILSGPAAGQPALEHQKILTGHRLILQGAELDNEVVEIMIDGDTLDSVAVSLEVNATEAAFNLPASIRAGMHEINVVHPVLMGSPEVPHKGVQSKPAFFSLAPSVTGMPQVQNRVVAPNGSVSATVSLTINPEVQPGQRVQLLLNELTAINPRSYTFSMPASAFGEPAQPISSLKIPVLGVKQGSYLLRIAVDDTESPLHTDSITQQYNAPLVNL